MDRRFFLSSGLAAGGMAAAGLSAGRPARATGGLWGAGPLSGTADLLGPGVRAESVLEIFAYGGISPFESTYVVEEYGAPDDPNPSLRNQQWHLFADDHQSVFGGDCGLTDSTSWLEPWRIDANGMQVNLGPLLMPLRGRSDILDRMRVVVMRHELEPHEAAIPNMLSGFRLGNVRLAGMGAHVQRWFQERDTTGRVTPFSYVLEPPVSFSTDNIAAASAVGLHPGSTRPLTLKLAEASSLIALLERNHVSDVDRAKIDALLAHYNQAHELRHATSDGLALRSRANADHAFAVNSLINAPNLTQILTPELLADVTGTSCDTSTNGSNPGYTGTSIRAAAQLFSRAIDPARYVCMIDTGIREATGGGGYDTHSHHLRDQTRNALWLFQHLADNINEPGEADPAKIDLDQTMVMITSEFGRTPGEQAGFGEPGTNHHPYGFTTILIGGPITPDQAGLYGAIGSDGNATEWITPSELRAAGLAAMGMYPFTDESFAVGDVRNVGTEADALALIKELVLGRS